MEDLKPPANATLVDRVWHYVETQQYEKAEALSIVGDYLTDCFAWELTFNAVPPADDRHSSELD